MTLGSSPPESDIPIYHLACPNEPNTHSIEPLEKVCLDCGAELVLLDPNTGEAITDDF